MRAKPKLTQTPDIAGGSRDSAVRKQSNRNCFAINGNQLKFSHADKQYSQTYGIELQTNILTLFPLFMDYPSISVKYFVQ